MNQGVLQGIRVLDFTRVLAGPYATRILADFGAETIKVQSLKAAKRAEANLVPYFLNWNRNKRSITLDLTHEEARRLVRRLVEMSDVLVENFSPRVMANWDLHYDHLRHVNPRLIMLSMSAMGQTGPWRNFVAFGPTLQSLAGLTHLTSFSEEVPIGLGYAYADIIAGLYGGLSVLAALEYRDRTGRGVHIDLSEYEAISTVLGPTLVDVLARGAEVCPQGNRSADPPAAPHGCYPCRGKDRWCVIAIFSEAEWDALCRVLGHPPWTRDPRFSSLSARRRHQQELDERLASWTRRRTAESVVARLQKAGVSAGIVQNARDLAEDPHLRTRGFLVPLDHPIAGRTLTDVFPVKVPGAHRDGWRPAPRLGEDNEYVFKNLLGLSEAEFAAYRRKGVIA